MLYQDIPLYGSGLIEASAGTGKTYTIAALYLRLVLGHGGANAFIRPLPPENILVITFTKAATQELRERIRRRLEEAAACFIHAQAPEDPVLQTLWHSYDETGRAVGAQRLRQAAEQMDTAEISTIHGWCHRMLREHAFESNRLFSQTLTADSHEALHTAVCDYWRTFLYPLHGEAAMQAVQKLWPDPTAQLKSMASWLPQLPDAPVPQTTVQVLLDAYLAQRRAFAIESRIPWAQWLPELEQLFDAAQKAKAFDGRKFRAKAWLAKMRAWLDDPEQLVPAQGEKEREYCTPEGLKQLWKDPQQVPTHPAFAALEALYAQYAALPDSAPLLKQHAGAWIKARIHHTATRRGELSFDEMLRGLDRALQASQGAILAQRLRSRFPVALVDEFQDTDPVQYRILESIYRPAQNSPDSGLLMIGDPKQAIYAFRGADIYTYLKARRVMGTRCYTLDCNFRSTPAMVSAVNTLFWRAEQHPQGRGAFLFRQGADDPLPFQKVGARPKDSVLVAENAPLAALQICELDPGEPLSGTHYQTLSAKACANTIARLLQQGQQGKAGFRASDGTLKPISAAHIAVLVRDLQQARTIREALAARQITSVFLSDRDSVLTTQEAQDLYHWLLACLEPTDTHTLLAALATPTLGLSWQALWQLQHDERQWENYLARFRSYRHLWDSQGILPMLHRFLEEMDLPGRLLARMGGERSLTNLLHLSEWLSEASVQVYGKKALIQYLYRHRQSANESDEAHILRLESDAALVKVVTIHKSKGLEYPLVFLPFICQSRDLDTKQLPLIYHNTDGETVLDWSPDAAALRQADQEQLAEDLRLLYVALTRARHSCWLGMAATYQGREKKPHRPAIAYLLGQPEGLSAETLGAQLHALAHADPAIAICAPAADTQFMPSTPPAADTALRPARRVSHALNRPARSVSSYSALTQDLHQDATEIRWRDELAWLLHLPDDITQPAEPPDIYGAPAKLAGIHAFPRGPATGLLLHAVLESLAEKGFDRWNRADQRTAAELHALLAHHAQVYGMSDAISPLTSWLEAILHCECHFPDGNSFTISTLGSGQYHSELEFYLSVHGVSVKHLDQRITQAILNPHARPALQEQQLHGLCKGFIDLIFCCHGRYYVLDYKSNWLGPNEASYSEAALQQCVLEKRYDVQAALYTHALHRHLQSRLPAYDPAKHLGGALFWFIRGIHAPNHGLLHLTLPDELAQNLLNG
ncbi:exodeoxyribonuclease V subunit beta [Thiorhodospira sibirica]|uniref:exodeoxyribonuclease V subunit beta n=1 Tax=Thiorhodospira sibirica TaxID=154347 RepID=UPI00022C52A9|nr:exodeoxyribonuclease V subunit beta [Thiorhodospira sibirica]